MRMSGAQSGRAGSRASLTMLTRMFWPEVFGGVERRTRQMAEAFCRAGLSVNIVSASGQVDRAIDCYEPGYQVDRARQPEVGWRWRWRDRVVSGWWAERLGALQPDGVIWATDVVAAGGAIRAGLGDRLIFNPPWCVAGMHSVNEAHRHLQSLRCRRGLRRLERVVYQRAHQIVGASHNVIEQLREAYGQRDGVHVVPHGVEPVGANVPDRKAARKLLGLGADELVIGLVCRIEAVKDIGFLLGALALAPDAVDRLLIVGEGPARQELEAEAEQLGVSQRIVWTGRMDEPAMAYRAMDAMVLPSIYEAFGNVVLEAMAAGVPVIGRRRCADRHRPVLVANDELIEHGRWGWLVDSHDPADLARLLMTLRSCPGSLRTAGASALAHANESTWQRTIGSYLSLLGMDASAGEDRACAA